MKRVKDIMTKDPECCSPETSIEEAARMMCNFDCGEIPVIDNAESLKAIGVLTDRDITCRSVAQGRNPMQLKVKDCMTSPCITVSPEMSVEECCEVLEKHQIRRVPVIDAKHRICGIVSQAV